MVNRRPASTCAHHSEFSCPSLGSALIWDVGPNTKGRPYTRIAALLAFG